MCESIRQTLSSRSMVRVGLWLTFDDAGSFVAL